MNKLIFALIALILLSCNNSQKENNQLQGSFKYTAFRWNDDADSVGVSLLHYLEVLKDGNYKLILRDDAGNAGYYYGYVDNDLRASLIAFTKDSSLQTEYLKSDSVQVKSDGKQYRFDYINDGKEKRVAFITPFAPDYVKNIQLRLDSLINGPGKKQSSHFNINDYLKKIIREDSAGRLNPPPKIR